MKTLKIIGSCFMILTGIVLIVSAVHFGELKLFIGGMVLIGISSWSLFKMFRKPVVKQSISEKMLDNIHSIKRIKL